MLRVGVIGCGYWGAKHLRVLSTLPGIREVVAIDRDEFRLARARGVSPGIKTETDLERVLHRLDALVIATPAHTHAEIGRRAIEVGVSVLIEKPMATTLDDAEMLVSAAASAGRTLMVGHTFEYNPAVVALRRLIASGDLGDVYYIDTARLNLGLYQPDVNVIWDLAPHDVSIVNYLLDSTATSARAWAARYADSDREDVAYLQLEYPDRSASAQVHVSWLDPCKVRRVTVVGSKKMAVYNDLNADEPIRVYDKGLSLNPKGDDSRYPVSYRYGSVLAPYIEFEEPLLVEDRHFLECVMTGEQPRTDGHSGLAVVKTLAAANEAVETGVHVEVGRRPAVV